MQKIDLVYMWVDGNDPKWQQEKEKWLEWKFPEKSSFEK